MFRQPLAFLLTALALALAAPAAPAFAQQDLSDVANIDILPGWRTESGTHMAGIRIRLAPGWKTYWRSPGSVGIPPSFSWSGSRNLESVRIHWPRPEIIEQFGLISLGYKHEVVIPVELTPKTASPDSPIYLKVTMELGVCKDICLPTSVKLRAELPLVGASDPAIRASLSRQPLAASAAGVRAVSCRIEPASDGLRVTATVGVRKLGSKEMIVMELPDKSIWISEATTTRRGRTLTATADMVPPQAAPFSLSRSDIRLTVLSENTAIDIQGCPAG